MNLEQIAAAEATRAIWAAKVKAALADQATVNDMITQMSTKPITSANMTIAPTSGASAECRINFAGEGQATVFKTFTPDLYVRPQAGQVNFEMPSGMGFLNEVLYSGAVIAGQRLAYRIAQLEAEGVQAGYISQ
jgi:hypothetical protein